MLDSLEVAESDQVQLISYKRESGIGNREKILCLLLRRFVTLARLARKHYAIGFLFIVLMVGERLCF